MQTNDNIIDAFISSICQDIIRRTKKEYDIYSLSETTNLPLFCCEKLFLSFAPNSLVFNNQIFNTVIKKLFFCRDFSQRLSLIFDICDSKHKKLISKKNIKLLFNHLHHKMMNYKTFNLLLEIIDDFFGNCNEMNYIDFVERSKKTNGDIAYLFFVFLDKFSFGNQYERLSYLNTDVFGGSQLIEQYIINEYETEKVSHKAIEYANMINKADMFKASKCFFDNDDDDQLNELDDFENEVSGAIDQYEKINTNKYNNLNSSFYLDSAKEKNDDDDEFCSSFIEAERINKALDLLLMKKNIFTVFHESSSTACKFLFQCLVKEPSKKRKAKELLRN